VMNGVSWVNSNCIAFEIMSVWGAIWRIAAFNAIRCGCLGDTSGENWRRKGKLGKGTSSVPLATSIQPRWHQPCPSRFSCVQWILLGV
jgi:hypothetical protein